MHKTVVINVVALSPRVLGEHTPFLTQWIGRGQLLSIEPVLPAVTCAAQATYLTGQWPSKHGIVGNGWYFRDECEIRFWRQSNKLVQAPKVWDIAKKQDPNFTCANLFWWYNMYATVDYSVTPRPLYPADGRKIPDIYTHPMGLRYQLQEKLGQFPLFQFWGPYANINASRWIAESAKQVDGQYNPTLTFIYLPHLDYNLQRHGIDFAHIAPDLQAIDGVCRDLITYYEAQGAHILLLSEYGITNVSHPIYLNRILREHGYVSVKEELGLELLDAGASQAFAIADHQLAHVHVREASMIPKVRLLLEGVEGIQQVLDVAGQEQFGINHGRAGELVVVAQPNAWFSYYYWLDDAKAPDFARTVDIHRKPGYDPVELFTDPTLRLLPLKVGIKLLRKRLGFRYLMDVIPLDATLVRGSHGRINEQVEDRPLLASQRTDLLSGQSSIAPTEVMAIILAHLDASQ